MGYGVLCGIAGSRGMLLSQNGLLRCTHGRQLFPILCGNQPGVDAELLALLSQVALELERAGNMPPPRYGIAALLGQHLKMILKTRLSSLRIVLDQSIAQATQIEPMGSRMQSCDQAVPSSYTESYNTLSTEFDPVLTTAVFTGEEAIWQDEFGDFLQELFGQRFEQ